MGRNLFVITVLILTNIGAACADCAKAYWTPFDAELYAPETESTIESRAFEKNSIPENLARELVQNNMESTKNEYNPDNVRAVIRTQDGDIYFDRLGWIHYGENYGKADIIDIEKILSTPCTAN